MLIVIKENIFCETTQKMFKKFMRSGLLQFSSIFYFSLNKKMATTIRENLS